MTNRQAAAAETRKRLVAAAKDLICTKGLVNVSVEEITQACGVSKGTFYTYFKRKEDVVLELSQGMFGEILSDAMAVSGGILPRLRFYMIHFSDYIEKGSVKMAQDWIGNVAHPELCQEGVNKLHLDSSALESLLSMGISDGDITPSAPAKELAYCLTEVLYGQLLCWVLNNGSYSLRQRTEDYCKTELKAFLTPHLIS